MKSAVSNLTMLENQAAWQVADKAASLEVRPAPYKTPGESQIWIRVRAVAINPVDQKIQELGTKLFPNLQYPLILGSDVAGDVVEVGSQVKRFKVGDRVCGMTAGFGTNEPTERAFQEYCVLSEHLASPVPDSLSYEHASVLPLCLCTSACGLFHKDYLGLELPSLQPKPAGKSVLIWGGASSVGSNAIQLAVAAGYDVVTTASSLNHDYVKSLGARSVVDYRSKDCVGELAEALKGRNVVGAYDCIGVNGAHESCAEVLLQTDSRRFMASAMPPPQNVREGVTAKFVVTALVRDGGLSRYLFEDFLPRALAQGTYKAAPSPKVVGKGLESLQKALDAQKKGNSAAKLVVTL